MEVKMELKPRNDLRIVEASLFISPEPIEIRDLKRILGISSKKYILSLIKKLKKEYDDKHSAVVVVIIENKFAMRVKDNYLDFVKDLNRDTEISRSALKVLAYISKKDGVLKSRLAKRIGSQVYNSVKELIGKGFITQKKYGRTSKLFVTSKFKNYFRLNSSNILNAVNTNSDTSK